MKYRTIDDLNQHIVPQHTIDYWDGFLDAINTVNDMQGTFHHDYLLGDCVLFKLNLVSKRRVRKRKPTASGGE